MLQSEKQFSTVWTHFNDLFRISEPTFRLLHIVSMLREMLLHIYYNVSFIVSYRWWSELSLNCCHAAERA